MNYCYISECLLLSACGPGSRNTLVLLEVLLLSAVFGIYTQFLPHSTKIRSWDLCRVSSEMFFCMCGFPLSFLPPPENMPVGDWAAPRCENVCVCARACARYSGFWRSYWLIMWPCRTPQGISPSLVSMTAWRKISAVSLVVLTWTDR